MAVYDSIDDVKGRVPRQIWEAGPSSQPSVAEVTHWLAASSAWVEDTLRWKYAVPVTDETDGLVLRQAVSLLVAAQVWDAKGSFNPQSPGTAGADTGARLRKAAYELLGYDPKLARSSLVLPGSVESDSGEAAGGLSDSSFSDPDDSDGVPRLFTIRQEF